MPSVIDIRCQCRQVGPVDPSVSKTQVEGGGEGNNAKGGKQGWAAQQQQGLPIIIKLVCPHDRSGSVIGKVCVCVFACVFTGTRGKRTPLSPVFIGGLEASSPRPLTQGGDVVKTIRNETGTKVKIEDTVPGLKERAVTVSAPDRLRPSPPLLFLHTHTHTHTHSLSLSLSIQHTHTHTHTHTQHTHTAHSTHTHSTHTAHTHAYTHGRAPATHTLVHPPPTHTTPHINTHAHAYTCTFTRHTHTYMHTNTYTTYKHSCRLTQPHACKLTHIKLHHTQHANITYKHAHMHAHLNACTLTHTRAHTHSLTFTKQLNIFQARRSKLPHRRGPCAPHCPCG